MDIISSNDLRQSSQGEDEAHQTVDSIGSRTKSMEEPQAQLSSRLPNQTVQDTKAQRKKSNKIKKKDKNLKENSKSHVNKQ